MIDEKELVQNLWPNGIQPITDAPSIIKQNDSLLITCNTPGASIGYKIVDKKHQISDIDSWRVYTGPIVMNEGSKVVAVAHRLGFKRSVAVEFIN